MSGGRAVLFLGVYLAAAGAMGVAWAAEPPKATPLPATAAAAARSLPIEARVLRLEQLIENQALDELYRRLDRLQQEVMQLVGALEEQSHGINSAKERQRDVVADFDRRLRAIEQKIQSLSTSAPSPPASSVSAPAAISPPDLSVPPAVPPAAINPSAPPTDLAAEQSAYQRALDALKEGRNEHAISEFQNFVITYPTSEYVPNAHYWLGEANYGLKRFEAAISAFRKVVEQFSASTKAPDAALKLGFAYYELGDFERARVTLTEVTTRFPTARAATLASERLRKMRGEGR